MNEVMVFNNSEFGEIRTLTINNEPWFVGKDVAEVLGYVRPTKAIQDKVDTDDKDEVPIQDSIGRMQSTPIINESGLYGLILSSKLPTAKKFKRWVTSEVLPTIRKTGSYGVYSSDYDKATKEIRLFGEVSNVLKLNERNKLVCITNILENNGVDSYFLPNNIVEDKTTNSLSNYISGISVENRKSMDVYGEYLDYCNINNIAPVSQIEFGKKVRTVLGYKTFPKRVNGSMTRVYTKM